MEDNSQLRRGIPGIMLRKPEYLPIYWHLYLIYLVAHKIYGVPQTINTANYVYFLAFQELFKLRDLLVAEGGSAASRAQNLEQMVTGKTF